MVSGNINIIGNILLKNTSSNLPNILQYMPSNNQIKVSNLLPHKTSTNLTGWNTNYNDLLTNKFIQSIEFAKSFSIKKSPVLA